MTPTSMTSRAWGSVCDRSRHPDRSIDAIVVKIRHGQVTNRPVYATIGVTVDGQRDILGLWVGTAERSPSSGCRC